LILTVSAGVVCTLACPHETVRTFCSSGHHDCCPKQNTGSAEACLSSNFMSSAKYHPPAIAAVAPIQVETVDHPVIAVNQQQLSIDLPNALIAKNSVVLRIKKRLSSTRAVIESNFKEKFMKRVFLLATLVFTLFVGTAAITLGATTGCCSGGDCCPS